jgi:O-antigen/teichoic acid export membrane protein
MLGRLRGRMRSGGLARDTAWAIALEAIQLVGSLVGFTIIAQGLPAVLYSGYVAVFGVLSVIGPPIAGGLVLAVLHYGAREHEDLDVMVGSALTLVVRLGSTLAGVTYLLANSLNRTVPRPAMLLIILSEVVVYSALLVVSALVQAYGNFTLAMQIRITPILMRVVGLVTLKLFRGLTLTNVSIVLLYSYLAAGLPTFLLARRSLGTKLRPGRARFVHLRACFTYGVGMSSLAAQNDGDKVALDHYDWKVPGAQYAFGYRLVQIGFAPVNGLLSATHTRFLSHNPSAKGEHFRRSVKFAGLAFAYGLAVSLVVFLGAPLVPKVFGDKWDGSVPMIRLLAPIVLLRALGQFPLNGILGLGRHGVRTLILVLGAIVSVASYVLLVPAHSWKGAVVGTLISEFALAVAAWVVLIVLQRRHNVATESSESAVDGSMLGVEHA